MLTLFSISSVMIYENKSTLWEQKILEAMR
jgi:hypothetical protein